MVRFEKGKKVKIKTYRQRPFSWNSNGEMDRYMGNTVTMVKLIKNNLYIKEDYEYWSWSEENFEELCIFNKLDDELFKI